MPPVRWGMRVSRPETLSGFFLSLLVELPSVPVVARDLLCLNSLCVCVCL